jgi:hypothetical protein
MATLLLSLLVAAQAANKASAMPPTNTNTRQCVQLEIPVKLSSFTTTKWNQPRVDSTVDTVDWVDWMTTWTTPSDKAAGNVTVSGTFKINGQLCVPPKGARSDVLQLATHGVGFDKR